MILNLKIHRSLVALFWAVGLASAAEKPNVLFIAVDDLNDWVGHLDGHPQAKTPNIDRLAQRGVSFTRAYCSAPLCNPSRISLLTGIQPSNSGVYGNGEQLRDKLPDAVTLMAHLRANGYTAKGGGKIFHGAGREGDVDAWDYYHKPERIRSQPIDPPDSPWAPWGAVAGDDDDMYDGKVVNWTIDELGKPVDQPFFLACGFTKPHLPWYAPQKYFDLHPIESIVLPDTLDHDRDDLPEWGQRFAREVHDVSNARNFATLGEDHDIVLKHGQWSHAVQSYLATISFVDAQIGRLLDALDRSPHADNTIIVLWGDHGWHLGEKQHWRKHALWETTTRTPLIITTPDGLGRGQRSARMVSLIDLYPTLIELCVVPAREGLDGQSLVPLLRDPQREWTRPVLTTFGYQNHAVRTERWRYIRYEDGGEELYDHSNDPNEWHNLASQSQHAGVIAKLKRALPTENRRPLEP